jgi:ABC-type Fe3+ transport system substrate-binding protein
MKTRMRACVLALAMSWFAASAHAAEDPAVVAAAKKEGEVVWYTTLIVDQAVRPLVAAFEKKYPGIKVRPVRSQGPETTLQLLQEARAGNIQADVMDAVLSGVVAIPEDLMLPAPASMTSVVPAADRLPGDRWVQIAQYYSCIAINTDLVKDSDAPRTLEDLLDPKWKGKMVWHATPDLTGPPGFIGLVLTQMGKEKGMDYLRKLAAQKITVLPSSQRGVMDQMISGAYSIQLMAVTHHAVISAKQGAPVRWLKIDPLIATGSYIGLINKVHHPNAARLLADFVLSDEGQTVLRNANYIPASSHVDALEPTLKPGPGKFKPWVMTPDIARNDLPGWVDIYKQLFQ